MSSSLIINATLQETRVALLEDGDITDYYLERRRNQGVVGNIYKGKVIRVLPGMQAAFVDVGLEKAAFLYVSDVYDDHNPTRFENEDGPGNAETDDEPDLSDDEPDSDDANRTRRKSGNAPIESLLKQGQDILVQISKDPISTKGARATCHVSLPGRYLVFMPTVDHLGISRQITSERERRRLRRLANEMRPKGGGFILRTASAGIAARHLRNDMAMLIAQWNEILAARAKSRAPALLYEDLDLILRAARDLATADLQRLIIDNREDCDRVLQFIDSYMPRFAGRVVHYRGPEPIFDAYGIEAEIDRAMQREVRLASGGHLTIDRAEALTAIDVNTGKFVGKESLEKTILQTNLEAAQEIAFQLRLRNIGGLIVLDFIDMDDPDHRRQVVKALENALESDRGRVKISRLSEFGLVEMTRKRTRESLEQMLCERCPTCDGTGIVLTAETVANRLLRELKRQLSTISEQDVRVRVHPHVANLLKDRERASVRDLEMRMNKRVHISSDGNFRIDKVDLYGETPKSAQEGSSKRG